MNGEWIWNSLGKTVTPSSALKYVKEIPKRVKIGINKGREVTEAVTDALASRPGRLLMNSSLRRYDKTLAKHGAGAYGFSHVRRTEKLMTKVLGDGVDPSQVNHLLHKAYTGKVKRIAAVAAVAGTGAYILKKRGRVDSRKRSRR